MAHEQEETPAYHEELQAVLKMLTTMALLHEAQLAIHRQDTAFRHLLEDRCPGQSGHDDVCLRSEMARDEVGDARKVGGANAGHPLPAPGEDGDGPLREDGWLPVGEVEGSGAGVAQRGRDSDPGYVKDPEVTPLSIAVVREALQELVAMSTRPLVVTRYHATRKLAEQYTSPTLTMLLEVGNRTEEADVAWKRLHKLERSAVWVASGAFLRREHMQRSPLAQRLATVTGC